MSRHPRTLVDRVSELLDDHCAPDEIAVLLRVDEHEVRRIALLLAERGPADPAPDVDVQALTAIADEVLTVEDDEPTVPTAEQVKAAAVLCRRATSGSDLDDLAGALGIRHVEDTVPEQHDHDEACDRCNTPAGTCCGHCSGAVRERLAREQAEESDAEIEAFEAALALANAGTAAEIEAASDAVENQATDNPQPWRMGAPGATCCICGRTVDAYIWHSRLGVAVCNDCPKTDVLGEDITSHCVFHVQPQEIPCAAPSPSSTAPACSTTSTPMPSASTTSASTASSSASSAAELSPAELEHVHEPFVAWHENGIPYATCTCGETWERTLCEACPAIVTALWVAQHGPRHKTCIDKPAIERTNP